MPDSVSIRSEDNLSSVEKTECQLHCDIINVAPARNLAVLWYHGNETIDPPTKGEEYLSRCSTKQYGIFAVKSNCFTIMNIK